MIKLEIDGKRIFPLFVAITKSINNAVGDIQFEMAGVQPSIKVNSIVKATVDGEPMVLCRVEQKTATGSESGLVSAFYGREITCDLIDSVVPDAAKVFKTGVTLETMAEKITQSLGMYTKIINKAGKIEPFSFREKTEADTGQTALDFLTQYARKRGVFINSDGNGNLVFFRLENAPLVKKELKGTIESSAKIDYSQRFNRYIVKSQSDIRDDWGTRGSVSIFGEAIDEDIVKSRVFEFQAEETMTKDECKSRAEEEANIRRARSLSYSATVFKHGYKIGEVVDVNDKGLEVKGSFLIEEIVYTQTESNMSCELKLTWPDAYTLQAEIDAKTARKVNLGKYK